ncbi:MAG TPA: YCF48-related protein [Polyangiaceae bacterium]|nr:YCF48-related protein [Polyangiaceae bacterium]
MRATTIACFCALLSALGCSSDGGDKKPSTSSGGSTTKPPTSGWKAAVGDGGTLLETFDDRSWEVRKIGDRDLFAVSCIDDEVGWAVGARGFIGHTRDGGWSWPAQDSGVTSTLRAISFAFASDGSEVGLAVGDGATLLTTRDGGEHWTRVALQSDGALRGTATTEGATLLVAVGDRGLVLRSTDFGRHFVSATLNGAGDLYDIALDAEGGLALAVDSTGALWVSRDGAQTFELEHRAASALESVSLGHSATLGSAAGPGALLLRTHEGTWRELSADGASLHATLVGPREDRAYFAGDDGALFEASPTGALSRDPSDTHATLRGIEDLEAR